jgi:hypothetical protein
VACDDSLKAGSRCSDGHGWTLQGLCELHCRPGDQSQHDIFSVPPTSGTQSELSLPIPYLCATSIDMALPAGSKSLPGVCIPDPAYRTLLARLGSITRSRSLIEYTRAAAHSLSLQVTVSKTMIVTSTESLLPLHNIHGALWSR